MSMRYKIHHEQKPNNQQANKKKKKHYCPNSLDRFLLVGIGGLKAKGEVNTNTNS